MRWLQCCLHSFIKFTGSQRLMLVRRCSCSSWCSSRCQVCCCPMLATLHHTFVRALQKFNESVTMCCLFRKKGKHDKEDKQDSSTANGSITMQALPNKPAAAPAAASKAPAVPKSDPVAAALKGNEQLFSGKVRPADIVGKPAQLGLFSQTAQTQRSNCSRVITRIALAAHAACRRNNCATSEYDLGQQGCTVSRLEHRHTALLTAHVV